MPTVGRTPGAVFREFIDQLNSILSRTLTQMPLVPVAYSSDETMSFGFRPGNNFGAAPIRTSFGEFGLEIGQYCQAIRRNDGQYQLRTLSYRYAIGYPDADEPSFRWEYVSRPEDNRYYARHHFQSPVPTGLSRDSKATLFEELHLPTGWVSIEEVIRFCLNDLGAHTRLSPEEWHQLLTESHERFITGT